MSWPESWSAADWSVSWAALAFAALIVVIVVWTVLAQRRFDARRRTGGPQRGSKRPRPAAGDEGPTGSTRDAGTGPLDDTDPVPQHDPEPDTNPLAQTDEPETTPVPHTGEPATDPVPRTGEPDTDPVPHTSEEKAGGRIPARVPPGPVGTLVLAARPFAPSTPRHERSSTVFAAARFLGAHYVEIGGERVKVRFDLRVRGLSVEPAALAAASDEAGDASRIVRCRVVVQAEGPMSDHVQEEIPVATVAAGPLLDDPVVKRTLGTTLGAPSAPDPRQVFDEAVNRVARALQVTDLIDLGEAPTARIVLPPVSMIAGQRWSRDKG